MERYFYHGVCCSALKLEAQFRKDDSGFFFDKTTGALYRERSLFNFGYGQEPGFERIPVLSFSALIELVETGYHPKKKKLFQKLSEADIEYNMISFSNYYGAVAVIMEDHIEEFIDFLSEKIHTNYFQDSAIKQSFSVFAFDSELYRTRSGMRVVHGGIKTETYEEVLNHYPKWRVIAPEVTKQIYQS
jgi:AAA15 family ATPase/GTPase